MDRRTRFWTVLVAVGLLAVAGGAAILFGGAGVGNSAGPANAPSLVGVIVGVQSEGLDRVRGFTLRTEDGSTVPFVIGTLENGLEFPPGHLVEHQATAEPIRVWYQLEGDVKVAIRFADAP